MQINIETTGRTGPAEREAEGTWLVRHHGEVWHGTWVADDFDAMLLVQGHDVAVGGIKFDLPIDRNVLCDVIAAHLNADHRRD